VTPLRYGRSCDPRGDRGVGGPQGLEGPGVGTSTRQEVVQMVGGILSALGLIIIIAIAAVALIIGLVVRAVRGRPNSRL
jgi:hypothetical protein